MYIGCTNIHTTIAVLAYRYFVQGTMLGGLKHDGRDTVLKDAYTSGTLKQRSLQKNGQN